MKGTRRRLSEPIGTYFDLIRFWKRRKVRKRNENMPKGYMESFQRAKVGRREKILRGISRILPALHTEAGLSPPWLLASQLPKGSGQESQPFPPKQLWLLTKAKNGEVGKDGVRCEILHSMLLCVCQCIHHKFLMEFSFRKVPRQIDLQRCWVYSVASGHPTLSIA